MGMELGKGYLDGILTAADPSFIAIGFEHESQTSILHIN